MLLPRNLHLYHGLHSCHVRINAYHNRIGAKPEGQARRENLRQGLMGLDLQDLVTILGGTDPAMNRAICGANVGQTTRQGTQGKGHAARDTGCVACVWHVCGMGYVCGVAWGMCVA